MYPISNRARPCASASTSPIRDPLLYRIAFIVVTTLAVALGLLVGTLNSGVASLDLLWIQLDWPLGLIVLGAAVAGLLLGLLLAWFFSILPLRARLRKAARREAAPNSSEPQATRRPRLGESSETL